MKIDKKYQEIQVFEANKFDVKNRNMLLQAKFQKFEQFFEINAVLTLNFFCTYRQFR